MTAPRVTFACCNHNGAATLAEALGSALAQDFSNFEVLLIDDASTDDSFAIMERVAEMDARVRIIRNPSRRGLAGAQNVALEHARTEFLAFIDADDLWHREKIGLQLGAMTDDTAVVGCYSAVLDSQGHVTGWRVGRALSHAPGRRLPGDPISGGSVALFKTAAIRSVGGFDQDLVRREDWDMLLRLARDYRVRVVPRLLVGYRRGVLGMSSDYVQMVEGGRRVLGKLADGDASLSGRALARALASDLAGIAGLAVIDGCYVDARRMYREAAGISLRSVLSPRRIYIRAALATPASQTLLAGVTRRLATRRVGVSAGQPFPLR